ERAGLLRALPLGVLAVALTALGARTVARNADYKSELSIWQTVVDRWPRNPRAHHALAIALANVGRTTEGIAQFEEEARLQPHSSAAGPSFGNALAAHLQPVLAAAHLKLGNSLLDQGHFPEAIVQFEEALRLEPELAAAHVNLGKALAKTGRLSEAITQLKTAQRLQPDLDGGHLSEAIARLEETQRSLPQEGRTEAPHADDPETQR
ncbi:MAG TPA: tetratricopeptide repeat protein, partial [Myxococcota bacterium]|nr:tetratricopeptide repeat protein [Myxococcota bacterium]